MHNIILVILYDFLFLEEQSIFRGSYLLVQLECVGLHESQKSNTLSKKKCSEEKWKDRKWEIR